MESALNWSMVVSIIGVLVVLTNIVVQVLKKLTWDGCRRMSWQLLSP